MNQIRTETDLDDSFKHARLAAVISSWARLGVFEAMNDGKAHRLETLPGDTRALRVTARILAHAGLLVCRGDQWALSLNARKLVEKGTLGRQRAIDVLADLSRLPQVLADGGPLPNEDGEKSGSKIGINPDDPESSRRFLEMLYRRSADSARQTAMWIDDALDAPGHVLDLGGGHGRYGREAVELGHQATLIDFPVCVDIAREMHGDKLGYIEGDFFEEDLGGPYDAILASNIVHGLSLAENRELVARAASALAPGGVLILKDMFLDEFGVWPRNAVYFGLSMLMYTDKGDSYSLTDVTDWFGAAGLEFCDPVVYDAYSLVVGQRPA